MDFLDSNLYIWVVLPILVFVARVVDVSLGTLRIIFISQGKRTLAPILGGIEVFIWITIVSQIVRSANNLLAYIAYAVGFAVGNFIGMYIEGRLAIGTLLVLTIVQDNSERLTTRLHAAGYGVTCADGEGANGPVKLVYTIVPRRSLKVVLNIIHESHPHAFLTIQDVRSTQQGVFPITTSTQFGSLFPRKSK